MLLDLRNLVHCVLYIINMLLDLRNLVHCVLYIYCLLFSEH